VLLQANTKLLNVKGEIYVLPQRIEGVQHQFSINDFLAFPKSFWGLVGSLKPPYHCIDLVSSPQKYSQQA
jgi:hypothetical protein